MRLPILNYIIPQMGKSTVSFHGLNKNLIIDEDEFSDMKNITASEYPVIGTRQPRGEVIETIINPNGMLYKNGLFLVKGVDCYYEDIKVGTVTDGRKQLIGMGAYILIFPDKKYFNTHSKEFGNIEKMYTQQGNMRFEPVIASSSFTKITAPGMDFRRYDSVEISGCQNSNYNKTTVIQEVGDGYIIVTGVLQQSFTQSSGIVIKRTMPELEYICESNNRLWGCNSTTHEIYASRLGDPFNWKNFEGIASDSYVANIGSDGDFTGCISHMGYVLFFKENMILKVFGDKPSNFQITPYTLSGVKKGCSSSLCIVNESLYYVGTDGIYTYDGSTPISISQKLAELEIQNAISGYQNKTLYISCIFDGKQTLLSYDTQMRIWCIEDDTEFLYVSNADGKLYYIDSLKQLRTVKGKVEKSFTWFLESGKNEDGTSLNKYITKIIFNLWLAKDSKAEIYIKFDDELLWRHIQTLYAKGDKTYSLPIIPVRYHKFRYKITGKGQAKLLSIVRYLMGGSEINGFIQYWKH